MSRDADDRLRLRLERNDPTLDYVYATTNTCCDLAKAFQGNKHVRHLCVELRYEGIIEPTAEDYADDLWQAFCKSAQTVSSLEQVSISFDVPSSEDYGLMSLLLQHTRKIEELVVSCSEGELHSPFLRHLGASITGHDALRAISLFDFHRMHGESLSLFMPTFSSIPNLRSLTLSPYNERYLGDKRTEMVNAFYLRQLLSLQTLEKLDLSNFHIGADHSVAMQEALSSPESSTLRHLSVCACDMTLQSFGLLLQGVAKHLHLKALDLFCTKITDYHVHGDASLVLAPLSHSKSLASIVVSFCDLPEDQQWPRYDFVLENTALKNLFVGSDIHQRENFASLYPPLRFNSSLDHLSLAYCRRDDGVDSLVGIIRDKVGLKRFDLVGHNFSGAQLLEFVPALAQNTTLEHLTIFPYQDEGNADFTDMATFVKAVITQSRLKILVAGPCSAEHMESLVPVMAQNYCLEEVTFESWGSTSAKERTPQEMVKPFVL